jgi:copper chaperone
MVTFRVTDMTCGHCASTIAKAVTEADKGARLAFDLHRHLAQVQTSSASTTELQVAMQEAGYHSVVVNEILEPTARQGGCGCGCGPKTTTDSVDAHQTLNQPGISCCS